MTIKVTMERTIIKSFWNCGDTDIIKLACDRAGLTKHELEALNLLFTECMTQEEAAEAMEISTRKLQELWYSASKKLLQIYWVHVIAKTVINN